MNKTSIIDEVIHKIVEQIQYSSLIEYQLTFHGEELDGSKSLSECGIQHRDILELTRE